MYSRIRSRYEKLHFLERALKIALQLHGEEDLTRR